MSIIAKHAHPVIEGLFSEAIDCRAPRPHLRPKMVPAPHHSSKKTIRGPGCMEACDRDTNAVAGLAILHCPHPYFPLVRRLFHPPQQFLGFSIRRRCRGRGKPFADPLGHLGDEFRELLLIEIVGTVKGIHDVFCNTTSRIGFALGHADSRSTKRSQNQTGVSVNPSARRPIAAPGTFWG